MPDELLRQALHNPQPLRIEIDQDNFRPGEVPSLVNERGHGAWGARAAPADICKPDSRHEAYYVFLPRDEQKAAGRHASCRVSPLEGDEWGGYCGGSRGAIVRDNTERGIWPWWAYATFPRASIT